MPQVKHETDICVELSTAVMDPPSGDKMILYRNGKVIQFSSKGYGENESIETREGRITKEGIEQIDELLYTRRFLGLEQTPWDSADGAVYEITYHYADNQNFYRWDDNFTDKKFKQYYMELEKIIGQHVVMDG